MTNTTKFTAAALFSALVLGAAFAGTNNVSAAQDGSESGLYTGHASTSETGHAYVEFNANDKGNPVITPGDPGTTTTPIDPGDNPNITNEVGSLTLDAIPASLNFGQNQSTGSAQTVKLLSGDADTNTAAGDTRKNAISDANHTTDFGTDKDGKDFAGILFAQETNLSSSANIKWSLSAALSPFTLATSKTDPKQTGLDDATITLGSGVSAFAGKDGTWTKAATDLTTSDIVLKSDGTSIPIISGSMQKGVFQQQWKTANVSLNVPQAATVGKYTADIAWTLSATPEDELDAKVEPAKDTSSSSDGAGSSDANGTPAAGTNGTDTTGTTPES